MEVALEKEKKNIIFGKYKVTKIIGSGSFGNVYQGQNILDNKKVAIKVEKKDNGLNLLEKESFYLYNLKGVGIPEVISFGYSGKYNILVQTLLGESLGKLFFQNNFYFSVKDICMFSIQILQRIEHVHSKYIIHRDIKPENFLIGEPDKYLIYIIDFGLSKKYKSSRTNKHIQFQLTKKFTGTARYASINAVRGAEQSRRDDLEAIGYMLLFFFNGGKLPWQGISCKSKAEKYIKIYSMKKHLNFESFCKNMPKEIITYVKYCRELEFEQKPDYNYLRGLFENILKKEGLYNDLHFSWIKDLSILKSNEIQSKLSQLNLKKRKASPQGRILRKLEKSREVSKEKEKENESSTQTKNNSIKKKDNIVILKPKSNNPQYIIHKRINSSRDNTLIKSKDSENFKSGIAQINISIDDERMTDKTSLNKQYDTFFKVKDLLSVNKESFNKNISSKNNNSLYYFSGNINDLSKSLVLGNINGKKINKPDGNGKNNINKYNPNKKQNSNFYMRNRVISSKDLNNNQNMNNLISPNVIKSFSFIKTLKPESKETEKINESINILNKTDILNKYDISTNLISYNSYNNNLYNNENIKTNMYNLKNRYHNLRINNDIKNNIKTNTRRNIRKQNTNSFICRNKNNIYININGRTNNSSKTSNDKISNKNQSLNINNQISKKIENKISTDTSNKKGKIIKMKVNNIPIIKINPLNILNCKSALNILKKNVTPNNLQQNLKFRFGLNTENNNLNKENVIEPQKNIKYQKINDNNKEGKINKINSKNVNDNKRKDKINNYKYIKAEQMFKINSNKNNNIIKNNILNINQNRINKYKNIRHKVTNKINDIQVQKYSTRITETSKQKSRISNGTLNNTINNCNTINNTINGNNYNNTIISIFNNYNIRKDNSNINNRFMHKKNDNFNIALDTLNNINKEKKINNYYYINNGYKTKLKNYKSHTNLDPNYNTGVLNMTSPFVTSNYKTLSPKYNNDNNNYNTQIISNNEFLSNYDNTVNINMRNYFSLNNKEKTVRELKPKKKISCSKPNLNLNVNWNKIKKIFSEFTKNQKTKKIERNHTQNFMNLNQIFSMNKRKIEKNYSSINITKSNSFLNGSNFINNNNHHHFKSISHVISKDYGNPTAIRKNTDIFYLGKHKSKHSCNFYDSKLIDENKNDDSFYNKPRAQSRDYYNFFTNKEKENYNIFL